MSDEEREKLLAKIQKLEKDLKIARLMVEELADENEMLWEYMEELKQMEIAEYNEEKARFYQEFMKKIKTVGDAWCWSGGLNVEQVFQIGDLVILKQPKSRKKTIRGKIFINENHDKLGVGIIVEKLEELLVFPPLTGEIEYDTSIEEFNDPSKSKYQSISTNISKVYWMKIDKMRWEYEEDLDIYRVEV